MWRQEYSILGPGVICHIYVLGIGFHEAGSTSISQLDACSPDVSSPCQFCFYCKNLSILKWPLLYIMHLRFSPFLKVALFIPNYMSSHKAASTDLKTDAEFDFFRQFPAENSLIKFLISMG